MPLPGARRPAIAVCGAGDADSAQAALAYQLGQEIARGGCTLVCGGLGGVMEAAARGAREARDRGSPGLVLGIVPGTEPATANAYCDVVVATGMGAARNLLVVLSADAVILVGGGSGTLSEAALAWQHGKPLVALAPSGGWAARLAGSAIDGRRQDVISRAGSAPEAVELALRSLS